MMPKIYIICRYCDWRETRFVYSGQNNFTCDKCKDGDVKVIMHEEMDRDVFGYNYKEQKKKTPST